ncbi:NUDIX hydrolase [Patescibacteria group bacterium]|nr:NUDIX hydrolase [Patescibacteria group bacterium]
MGSKQLLADISLKALIAQNNKVLVVLDKNGSWELPGGRMNEGESIKGALSRELDEELNLKIDIGDIFDAFTFASANGQNHFVVVYECKASDIQNLRAKDGEAMEVRWVGKEDHATLPMRLYSDTIGKYLGVVKI